MSTVNGSSTCWFAVGTTNPVNKECGDTTTKRLMVGNLESAFSRNMVFRLRNNMTTAFVPGTFASFFSEVIVQPDTLVSGSQSYTNMQTSTTVLTNPNLNSDDTVRTQRHALTHDCASSLAALQISLNTINFGANFLSPAAVTEATEFKYQVTGTTGASGTVTNHRPFYIQTPSIPSTMTMTTNNPFYCEAQNAGTNNVNNYCFAAELPSSGTNAAPFVCLDNTGSANGCMGAGSPIDSRFYRPRAGAWTVNSGTDIYTEGGNLCAGTGCAAMTTTNVGVYDSATRVARSLTCTGCSAQSFVDGVYTFTVPGGTVTSVTGTSGETEVSNPSPGVYQVGIPDDVFFVRAYASVAFNSPVFTSPSGSTVVSLSADNGVNIAARFYITTGFDTRPVWASTATSVQMTMETSAPNANFVIDSKGTGTLQLRPNAVPEFTCSSSGCSSATQLSGPKYTHTGSTPTLTDYGSGDGVCNNGAGVLATSTILGKDHILTVDVTTGNGACSTGQFIRINTGVTCPTSHICDVSCRGTGASSTNCRAINLSWSGTVDAGPIVAVYALTAATASTPYSFTVMCSCY